jgi:hypothetical protein
VKGLAPFLALFLVAAPTRARADDATDARDVEHASADIHQLAEQAHDHRVATLTLGVVSGAALLPSGIVLASRPSDEVGNILGTGMIVTGSVAMVLGAFELPASNIERMADTFDARREKGMSNAELLRLSYSEWRDEAAAARRTRHFFGGVEAIIGALSTAVGLTMLLASDGLLGLDRDRQYRIGNISLGMGVPFLGVGLRTLLIRSPEEQVWSMTQPGAAQIPRMSGFRVQGGGGATFAWAF